MLRHLFLVLVCVLVFKTTNATAQQTFVTAPLKATSSISLITVPVAPVTAGVDDSGSETHGVRDSGFNLLPALPFDFTPHSASFNASASDGSSISKTEDVRFDIGTAFKLSPKNTMTFVPRLSIGGAANSADDKERTVPDLSFQWKPALEQSLMFLAVQHGYAMTQPKTRTALKGKFFKDYFRSVRSLHGWDDGGRFFTNYIAHPMQGALTGYIQVQNDPRGIRQKFGTDKAYWTSRAKAMAWSAVWSTQFEIGLVSQASIGNVGLKGKQTWVDIVITPTAGTGLIVLEDAIDRLTRPFIESRTNNKYVRIFSRMLLNPTRNFANLLRFEKPWKRDVSY